MQYGRHRRLTVFLSVSLFIRFAAERWFTKSFSSMSIALPNASKSAFFVIRSLLLFMKNVGFISEMASMILIRSILSIPEAKYAVSEILASDLLFDVEDWRTVTSLPIITVALVASLNFCLGAL